MVVRTLNLLAGGTAILLLSQCADIIQSEFTPHNASYSNKRVALNDDGSVLAVYEGPTDNGKIVQMGTVPSDEEGAASEVAHISPLAGKRKVFSTQTIPGVNAPTVTTAADAGVELTVVEFEEVPEKIELVKPRPVDVAELPAAGVAVSEPQAGFGSFLRDLFARAPEAAVGVEDVPVPQPAVAAKIDIVKADIPVSVEPVEIAPVQDAAAVEEVAVASAESAAVQVPEAQDNTTGFNLFAWLASNSGAPEASAATQPSVEAPAPVEIPAAAGVEDIKIAKVEPSPRVSATPEVDLENATPAPFPQFDEAGVEANADLSSDAVAATSTTKNAGPGNLEQSWRFQNIVLTFENGQYRGDTGCNTFNGNYMRWFGNRVQILPVNFEGASCDSDEIARSEIRLDEKFPGSYEVLFDGNNLILLNDKSSWFFAPEG